MEHIQISGKLAVGSKSFVFSLIAPKLGDKLTIEAKSVKKLQLVSVLQYAKLVTNQDPKATQTKIDDLAKKEFERIVARDASNLIAEHDDAWQKVSLPSFLLECITLNDLRLSISRIL